MQSDDYILNRVHLLRIILWPNEIAFASHTFFDSISFTAWGKQYEMFEIIDRSWLHIISNQRTSAVLRICEALERLHHSLQGKNGAALH